MGESEETKPAAKSTSNELNKADFEHGKIGKAANRPTSLFFCRELVSTSHSHFLLRDKGPYFEPVINIMAGVGEASAVVGLIATAAQLSKAILGIAFKYKDAKKQIKGLGDEVASFGEVLDQMHHLLGRDHRLDHDVRSVLASIVNRSGELLSEIKVYKNSLCSRKGSVRNHSFRGRIKWGFEATKLEYLRARVQSQKADMLLMMNIHYVNNLDG